MGSTYFIHGAGCTVAGCAVADRLDALLPETLARLAYNADEPWETSWASLQSQIEEVDHNTVFIGESMGGFWASQLSRLHDARCYLLNPVIRCEWQMRQFIGHVLQVGRPAVSEANVRTFATAPDQRTPLNKGRVGLMLATGDTTIEPRYTEEFYAGHAAFADWVDDGHGITAEANFALIARRVRNWEDESDFTYFLRRLKAAGELAGEALF